MTTRQVLAPAWYRFRATFRQRRGRYLAIVVLLGLVGGIALGAIAGARRTQSSYPVYLASTRPADLQAFTGVLESCPRGGGDPWLPPCHPEPDRRLALVESQQTVVGFDANIDQISAPTCGWAPAPSPLPRGRVGAEYSPGPSDARRRAPARPGHPGQAVMNAQAGKELGIRVGSTITVTLNSDASSCRRPTTHRGGSGATAHRRSRGVSPGRVQRRLRRGRDGRGPRHPGPHPPHRQVLRDLLVQLAAGRVGPPGSGRVGAVERAAEQAARRRGISFRCAGARAGGAGHQARVDRLGRLRRASRPGRCRDRRSDHRTPATHDALDLQTLRALGAGPATTAADATIGAVAAVVAGALLASVVAVLPLPALPARDRYVPSSPTSSGGTGPCSASDVSLLW